MNLEGFQEQLRDFGWNFQDLTPWKFQQAIGIDYQT
jgi:hypothetical protein